VAGSYDYWLVLMSVVVAITSSFVALDLAGRVVAATTRRARTLWLTGSAISMGTGTWSMHLIGMLAYRLPIDVAYKRRRVSVGFGMTRCLSGESGTPGPSAL
jgi:NO-binding membrane sensor protein with MHYT domain